MGGPHPPPRLAATLEWRAAAQLDRGAAGAAAAAAAAALLLAALGRPLLALAAAAEGAFYVYQSWR